MHTDSRHTPWVREWQPVCLVFTQQFCLQYVTDTSDFNSAMWFPFAIFYLRTHGWGHSTLSSVKLISVTSLFQYNFMRGVAITRPFSFWCMRLNGLTFECIRPAVQTAKLYKSILLWLHHSIACVRIRKIATKIARVNGLKSCVYTLRLIGPVSYLGACYIRTKVREWRCTFVVNLLNHIYQDTKSSRLIAVCKRTLILDHRPGFK